MANQNYRIFPNKVELFKFFGQHNDQINVSVSSRLPMLGLALGSKLQAYRTFPEFFGALGELSGLDIDTKASTMRMGTYIVFFNKEVVAPLKFADIPVPVKLDEVVTDGAVQNAEVNESLADIDAILLQAAALNDEADKAGSKAKLIEFAASHGVTLKGNKTFDNLMVDFKTGLQA